MSPDDYEHQTRIVLQQLLPVTEHFPKLCRTEPCLGRNPWHNHFEFPDTIPRYMSSAAETSYEILKLGHQLDDRGHMVASSRQFWLDERNRAVIGWRALGIIR